MCSVIILSSSPPQLFARSPTPASSPGSILRGDVEGRHRFKAVVTNRDGFSSSFRSAGDVLRTNRRVQNQLFRDPKGSRDSETYNDGLCTLDKAPQHAFKTATRSPSPSKPIVSGYKPPRKLVAAPMETELRSLSETDKTGIARPRDESIVQAASQSLDGTVSTSIEPTNTVPQGDNPTLAITSFAYEEPTSISLPSCKSTSEHVLKRRKIEMIDLGAPTSLYSDSPPTTVPTTTLKAKKSTAPKKYTTITSLSTALYGHKATETASPIATFLTSTQAQAQEAASSTNLSIKPKAKKTRRVSKKLKPKPIVLSPESALKVYNVQDVMFGSASQLTRDHCSKPPDTANAHSNRRRVQDFDVLSDLVSTQLTQPISIQSETPRTLRGTNKFARTKNLWGAAGRDDDNALFHVESIDLFDSPSVENAFTTKSRPWNFDTPGAVTQNEDLQERHDPAVMKVFDIDDVTTPVWNVVKPIHSVTSLEQRRNLHTSPTRESPRKVSRASLEVFETQSANPKKKVSATTMPKPSKPSYAVLTTPELQRQLTGFGFKKIKKRETMIEVLEKCWESKHGTASTPDPVPPQDDPPVALPVKHSDFLSKVHGVSARPEPKVKKVPKPRKPREANGSPKVKRTAEPKEKKPRAPRKPRAKPIAVAPSDLETGPNRDAKVDNGSDADKTATLPVKPAAKARTKRQPKSRPAKTPTSEEGEEDTRVMVEDERTNQGDLVSPEAPAVPEIQSQITRAITTFQPDPYRNHQVDPTWHEKILMYDPIVLEDLTTWLNTEGFSKINEDREVGALEVRDWCESRGVCCLWKGGWRGNKSSKSGADEH